VRRQGEEFRQVEIAAADEEVVDQHYPYDGALENGVAAEEIQESIGRCDDTPGLE
jgi:hypothetical protein